jgi:hypothetical protein
MDTDTVSYTAQIDMTYTEQYFLDDDGTLSLIGESILERLADELPDTLRIELEFDTEEGELVGLCCESDIHHIAFAEMEKLRDGLSLDFSHEIRIIKTIYTTIYNELAAYLTPDGLAKVHADKVSDMADYADYGGDAIHEERRMEGGG